MPRYALHTVNRADKTCTFAVTHGNDMVTYMTYKVDELKMMSNNLGAVFSDNFKNMCSLERGQKRKQHISVLMRLRERLHAFRLALRLLEEAMRSATAV